MTDDKRQLLTKALGEEWFPDDGYAGTCNDPNRTFTSAQDYEDLLEKVVRSNLDEFCEYLGRNAYTKYDSRYLCNYEISVLHWFLTLSIEERCELICDFGVEVSGWETNG